MTGALDDSLLAQLAHAIEPAPGTLPLGPRRQVLWLGAAAALTRAAADAAALRTLDALLRDAGALRLACATTPTTAPGDATLSAGDARAGAALALALAPDLDALGLAVLDDEPATIAALRGLVLGAAAVALPVIVDGGDGGVRAVVGELPPTARAWLRAAQPGGPLAGLLPSLLPTRVGGAPGAAIALALLARR